MRIRNRKLDDGNNYLLDECKFISDITDKNDQLLFSLGLLDDIGTINKIELLIATQDLGDKIGSKSQVPCQNSQNQ